MADKITDPNLYASRRTFVRAAVLGASALATGSVYRLLNRAGSRGVNPNRLANLLPTTAASAESIASAFRVADSPTSFQDITHYNNYYEFSTDKEGVADAV